MRMSTLSDVDVWMKGRDLRHTVYSCRARLQIAARCPEARALFPQPSSFLFCKAREHWVRSSPDA